jgi:hypothetical protein
MWPGSSLIVPRRSIRRTRVTDVLCGYARSGAPFAIADWNVPPDISPRIASKMVALVYFRYTF